MDNLDEIIEFLEDLEKGNLDQYNIMLRATELLKELKGE